MSSPPTKASAHRPRDQQPPRSPTQAPIHARHLRVSARHVASVALFVLLAHSQPARAQAVHEPAYPCSRAVELLTGIGTRSWEGSERTEGARGSAPAGARFVETFALTDAASGTYVLRRPGESAVTGTWSCSAPGTLEIVIGLVPQRRTFRFLAAGDRLWFDHDTDPTSYFIANASSESPIATESAPSDTGRDVSELGPSEEQLVGTEPCGRLQSYLVRGRAWHEMIAREPSGLVLRFRRDGSFTEQSSESDSRTGRWRCVAPGTVELEVGSAIARQIFVFFDGGTELAWNAYDREIGAPSWGRLGSRGFVLRANQNASRDRRPRAQRVSALSASARPKY